MKKERPNNDQLVDLLVRVQTFSSRLWWRGPWIATGVTCGKAEFVLFVNNLQKKKKQAPHFLPVQL
jgi:hypothetical protein